jgi:tripartite ATP-independent transporter DctP family solute receptor
MKSSLVVALVLLAVVGLAVVPAAAQQPTVLRLGHTGGPGSLFESVASKYAAKVNDALKGKVEIQATGASKLGSDEQMIKGIKIGAPEMSLMSTVFENTEPKFGVFEMPYLIANRAHMKRVAENPKVQAALFEAAPSKGIRVLGMGENGFRHITTSVRAIEKPEDLKGLSLRVPSGAWRLKMFKAFGANPTPMPLGEVYNALKTGAVEAQENPLPQIAGTKFHEVQKFLSLTGHVYTPAVLLIGEDTWKKLPGDVQAVLAKVAAEMGDLARAEGERMDKELIAKLSPPLKVNDVNKEPFIRQAAGIYDEFGKQVPGGKDLVTLIQGLR